MHSGQWLTQIRICVEKNNIWIKSTNGPEQLIALLVCVGLQLCHWLVLLDEFEELWWIQLRVTTVKLLQTDRDRQTWVYISSNHFDKVFGIWNEHVTNWVQWKFVHLYKCTDTTVNSEVPHATLKKKNTSSKCNPESTILCRTGWYPISSNFQVILSYTSSFRIRPYLKPADVAQLLQLRRFIWAVASVRSMEPGQGGHRRAITQEEDCSVLLWARRNRGSTARPLQIDV